MIHIDKSNLNTDEKNREYAPKLMEFVEAVSLAKPLFEFKAERDCVGGMWIQEEDGSRMHKEVIHKVNVYENGERLGSIGIWERYHSGNRTYAYAVESFRIEKHRGRGNTTSTKDIKVALRAVKKSLFSRADSELATLIRDTVNERLGTYHHNNASNVRWSMDVQTVATGIAMLAYRQSRLGNDTLTIPTNKIPYVKDMEVLFQNCAKAETTHYLVEEFRAKRGYGVQVRDDGVTTVLTLEGDTIKRYQSFDELPHNIQEKLAVFKMLEEGEAFELFGIKLRDNYYYLVA